MKTLLFAALFSLLSLSAHAVDDLIYQPGVKVTTARSLAWNGTTYGNVQVMSRTSTTVVIASKKGPAQLPIKVIPSLWLKVIDKELPAGKPSPELAKWEAARIAYEIKRLNPVGDPFGGRPGDKGANATFQSLMADWETQHPKP